VPTCPDVGEYPVIDSPPEAAATPIGTISPPRTTMATMSARARMSPPQPRFAPPGQRIVLHGAGLPLGGNPPLCTGRIRSWPRGERCRPLTLLVVDSPAPTQRPTHGLPAYRGVGASNAFGCHHQSGG